MAFLYLPVFEISKFLICIFCPRVPAESSSHIMLVHGRFCYIGVVAPTPSPTHRSRFQCILNYTSVLNHFWDIHNYTLFTFLYKMWPTFREQSQLTQIMIHTFCTSSEFGTNALRIAFQMLSCQAADERVTIIRPTINHLCFSKTAVYTVELFHQC